MSSIISLNKVDSLQVRNLIRGLLANPEPAAIASGLQKMSAIASTHDFKTAIEILRWSELFRASNFNRYFSRKFSRPLDLPQYSSSEIAERINQNKKKLSRLIRIAKRVMHSILEKNAEAAFANLKELTAFEGVSVFLIRLAYLIKKVSDQGDIVRRIDLYLDGLQVGNIKYIQLAIRELSSPNTEYLNIRDKISAVDENSIGIIAKSFIDHIPRSEKQFLDILNSYFSISLLDAYLYHCSTLRCGLFAESKFIDSELQTDFNELAMLRPLRDYPDVDEPGLAFFKDAFLAIELDEFYVYRTIYGALYNNVEDRLFLRTPFENTALKAHFSDIKKLNDVKRFPDLESDFYSITSWFERSNALVYFLEEKDGFVEDENVFVELMSCTRDIGIMCQTRYLTSMSQTGHISEFKLVAACLAYIKSRTQLNEHELREVIQEIAIADFESDLVQLLDYLYLKSPSVTEHLIQVLDETFLTKLFEIIDRPNAAIEQRALIFEWYGSKVGDPTYLDRAKTLRIDVQINKAKGTIDDARIYVDPVKFTQWITDNLLDELSILAADVCSKGEPTLIPVAWDKLKSGISNLEQIGAILMIAYDEFCSNNKFGIASYIGRRIRHGTLKETGFNDVKNFPTRPGFAKLFASAEFDSCFTLWLRQYENCLVNLRDKYVQIQDKKKIDGLILKDFRTVAKKTTANHMLYEVLKSFYHNKNGQELPYIITEYCWRLIEEDLANIREFLMDQKSKHGVFRFDSSRDAKLRAREVQEFAQELNTLVAEKFRMIESWFNKPSIASPSAELLLLFKAVLSEIRGFFPDFEPELIFDDLGYVIRGGTYFVIYDALFIIIYNAAKYGEKKGCLRFGILIEDKDNAVHFKLIISSQIAKNDDLSSVQTSIFSALEGDFEDALNFEGRSGIKKLKKMEQDLQIRNVNYSFEDRYVIASFEFLVDYQS
jgi:hypothetical protein